MRPFLFTIFGFDVPSYAVLMGLGYGVALGVLFKLTPRGRPPTEGGLDRAQVWDLFIVMVVTSVIGSKIGHVLFEASSHVDDNGVPISGVIELLKRDPWHWAELGEPGYVWYGGMIAALIAAVIYFRRRPRLQAALYADAFAPAIMAGAAVGRIGCFLAGCCHGTPTQVPWGVTFPASAGPVHFLGSVHPTQLYDSVVAASLAIVLYRRFWKRKFDGEVISLLLMSYAVLRTITEMFRGDADRGGVAGVSTSQLLSIPLFLAGAYLYVRLSRRSGPAAAASVSSSSPAEGV